MERHTKLITPNFVFTFDINSQIVFNCFLEKRKKFIVQNMRETFVLNTDIYIVYLQKSYDYWVAGE